MLATNYTLLIWDYTKLEDSLSNYANRDSFLITGGVGFLGSHLVDTPMSRGAYVRIVDKLSSGKLKNIERWLVSPTFRFIQDDLLNSNKLPETIKDCRAVFHLAANPEVRVGSATPKSLQGKCSYDV
jgi:UDP-glucose 4-epimerase